MQEKSDKKKNIIPLKKSARSSKTNNEPMSRDEMRHKRYLERRKRNRRKKMIGYCAAAFVIVVAAVVLSLTVFFKISSFEVKGDEIYSYDEVIAASGLKSGENMFGFEREEVASQIETGLPYVGDVQIKRSPTGKITFTLTAAKAVMAIDNGESYTLLDEKCKVLETETQTINEDVAIIITSNPTSLEAGHTAVFENPDDANILTAMQKSFSDHGFNKVTQIDISDPANTKMKYDLRITLKIGAYSSLEDKIDFMKAALDKLDGEDPTFSGTMDFTIENKAFVNDVDEEKTTVAPEPETQPQAADEGEQQPAADGNE